LSDPSSKLANYTVITSYGMLTVNRAPLTITASNASKTYGQTLIFAGTEFTTSGLKNSDMVTSVTLTSTGAIATATVTGSPYNIVASAAVGTGLGNYTISYTVGHLTVSRANPSFSNLSSPAITRGNNSTATVSGHVGAGTTNAVGSVVITITNATNNVVTSKMVALDASGNLATTFTRNWTAGTYTIRYHYAGNGNFNATGSPPLNPDGSSILVVS
jgi:hypothetical protein